MDYAQKTDGAGLGKGELGCMDLPFRADLSTRVEVRVTFCHGTSEGSAEIPFASSHAGAAG